MISGERLSELRRDKRMRQSDLAKIIGVSARSISYYERGLRSPPDDIKIKLAKHFDVTVDYLMGLAEIKSYDHTGEYILLPKGCPDEVREQASRYIGYLLDEHRKKKRALKKSKR